MSRSRLKPQGAAGHPVNQAGQGLAPRAGSKTLRIQTLAAKGEWAQPVLTLSQLKVQALQADPGLVLQFRQALAGMEAMKMEHTLHAPRDGVVAELLYAVGDQVAEGGELLKLAPA